LQNRSVSAINEYKDIQKMFLSLNYVMMLSTPQIIWHLMGGLSVNNEGKSKISCFCHGVVEAFVLLGCYVA